MTGSVGAEVQRKNFLKLHYVYYQTTPVFLRGVFYEFWKAVEGSEWKNDKGNGIKLSSVNGIQGVLKNGKLQKKNVESGDSRLWDLSLLIDIIIVLKSTYPSVVTAEFDISTFTKKNLEWLKSTRNKLAHASSTEMDLETFQPLWDETIKVLTSLGMKEEDMIVPEVIKEGSREKTENELDAEEYKMYGNECFQQGNIFEAVVSYSLAIELEGISQEMLGVLYSNRSSAHAELGNYGGAKDDAKSAITLCPHWFKGYTRLGQAYEKSEQYIKAIFNYHLAIALGDDSEKTLNGMEYCKMMIQKLRRCETTDPEILRQKDLRNQTAKLLAGSLLNEDQYERFMEGTTLQLCTKAHRYYFGKDGYPQSFEKAADYFAQAAKLGDAEGLYNLGKMTQNGEGLEKNVSKGHKYILEAASKPPTIEYIPGSGMIFRNLGVMESWHHLGMAYQFGLGVGRDYKQALEWYGKAIEFGSGMSANNTAIIYDEGEPRDFSKAVEFWKLSVYLKTERAAENLMGSLARSGDAQLAQQWYHYATYMGSIDIVLWKEEIVRDPEIEKTFDPEAFKLKLQSEVESSPILSPILGKIKENQNPLFDCGMKILEGNNLAATEIHDKQEAIRYHRLSLQRTRKSLKESKNHNLSREKSDFKIAAANFIVTSSGVDLVHMKEIFWREIKEAHEDKVFTGRIIRLKVIEDAILGNPSIFLLAEDSKGDVGRLFVYNYPQSEETHKEIGYGCQFYLIFPHYRSMLDGMKGLRVDDAQLIFKQPHLRNANRCRYCGEAEGNKFECRKCRRVKYCSKLCLKKDTEERQHSLVCVKSLIPFNFK